MMGTQDDTVPLTELLHDLDGVSLPVTGYVGVALTAASDEQFDALDSPEWRSYTSSTQAPWKSTDVGRVHLTVTAPESYRDRHTDLERRAAVKGALALAGIDVTDEQADSAVRAARKGAW